jgi:hypothetical protein
MNENENTGENVGDEHHFRIIHSAFTRKAAELLG